MPHPSRSILRAITLAAVLGLASNIVLVVFAATVMLPCSRGEGSRPRWPRDLPPGWPRLEDPWYRRAEERRCFARSHLMTGMGAWDSRSRFGDHGAPTFEFHEFQFGWPFRCMGARLMIHNNTTGGVRTRSDVSFNPWDGGVMVGIRSGYADPEGRIIIPLKPIPFGLALDVFLHGAFWYPLFRLIQQMLCTPTCIHRHCAGPHAISEPPATV